MTQMTWVYLTPTTNNIWQTEKVKILKTNDSGCQSEHSDYLLHTEYLLSMMYLRVPLFTFSSCPLKRTIPLMSPLSVHFKGLGLHHAESVAALFGSTQFTHESWSSHPETPKVRRQPFPSRSPDSEGKVQKKDEPSPHTCKEAELYLHRERHYLWVSLLWKAKLENFILF